MEEYSHGNGVYSISFNYLGDNCVLPRLGEAVSEFLKLHPELEVTSVCPEINDPNRTIQRQSQEFFYCLVTKRKEK